MSSHGAERLLAVDEDVQRRSHVPLFLAVYLLALFAIPAQLVLQPLGAAGAPAALLATAGFVWWATARFTSTLAPATCFSPVRLAVLSFAVVGLLSYGIGMLRPMAGVELRSADRAVLTLIGWTGVAMLACDGLRSSRDLDRVLRAVTTGAAFLAALGILQFTLNIELAPLARHLPVLAENNDLSLLQQRSIFSRVSGTTSHPIEFGVVLATVFPLAAHYGFSGSKPSAIDRLKLLLIVIAIPMSVSRSAVLGLLVASVVLLAGWPSRVRRKALLVAPLMIVAMRLAFPGLLGTIKSLFLYLSVDPSIAGRTEDYAVVSDFVRDSPIIGRGIGTFIPSLYVLLDNQYLGSLIETGLIGVTALLTVFTVAFACARGGRRRSNRHDVRDLGQALAASVAVAALTFATFDGLGFPMAAGLTFLIVGCCGCYWRLQGGFRRPPPSDLASTLP
jgi:polysaccharide biosynthesis protein PslJ